MSGGLGSDTYVVDDAGDTVSEAGGDGTDLVNSSVTFILGAGLENLTLTGSANINGTGNSLNNTVVGNSGDNTLDGGGGADSMSGGLGSDTYVVDDAGDTVSEAGGDGTDTVNSAVTFILGAGLENLNLTSTANINGTGNSLNNNLVGNSGANILDGAAGADSLSGGTGGDTYVVDDAGDLVSELALGGTDTVQSAINYALGAEVENLTLTGAAVSGTGNALANAITGNGGNNTLDGGAGADSMSGGLGSDTYVVDDAGDTVSEAGGDGTDLVNSSVTFILGAGLENLTLTGSANINGTGNSLNNTVVGNSGDNTLDGGGGADSMSGGLGSDTYVVDDAGDTVSEAGGDGTDTVNSAVTFILGAGLENLNLTSTANINGTGNSLNNNLVGNSGANILDGAAGADSLSGGTGGDTYVVDDAGDLVSELALGGTDTVQSAINYALGAEVENLTLTGAAVSGTGNALANAITGNGGANVLSGLGGADTINAGAGNDTINYSFGDGVDVVDGGGDSDTLAILGNVNGQTLDLVFNGSSIASVEAGAVSNVEAVSADLAGGVDVVTFAGSSTGVTVNLALGTASGGVTLTNVESAFGGAFNDVLTGDSGANTLGGSAGADTLDGGAGADVLIGGSGNDLYIIADADTIAESAGGGVDTVQSSIDYALGNELENLTLLGAAINGTGNGLANVIFGNGNANTIDGGAGIDSMYGGAGGDTYIVDNTGDIVTENASGDTDIVLASATYSLSNDIENLTLTGALAINATGNSLANLITGNGAANTIAGGSGNDTINAAAGADTITYNFGDGVDNVDGGTDTDTMVILGNANGQTFAVVFNGALITSVQGGTVMNVESFSADLAGGVDTVTYAGSSAGVTINLATGAASGSLALTGVENAFGGAFNDVIIGDSFANTLGGSSGADTLTGGSGGDTILGGAGNDTIIYNFGDGVDTVDGGVGTDTMVILGNLNDQTLDLVYNGTSITTIEGGAATGVEAISADLAGGTDVVAFGGSSVGVTINLATGTASGGVTLANVEAAFGGAFNDFIIGDGNANTLGGSSGADTLTGGAGTDTLIGGTGADVFVFASGAGADTITDFDADAVGGQDLMDISALGVTASDFASRVVITDLGANTFVTVDGVVSMTLTNVSGDGQNVITQADFILGGP